MSRYEQVCKVRGGKQLYEMNRRKPDKVDKKETFISKYIDYLVIVLHIKQPRHLPFKLKHQHHTNQPKSTKIDSSISNRNNTYKKCHLYYNHKSKTLFPSFYKKQLARVDPLQPVIPRPNQVSTGSI